MTRRLVHIPAENIIKGFIVKVHGRRNLACDYCYMYDEHGKLWRERDDDSVVMSEKVIQKMAMRIREYMDEHRLSEVIIILHGGEPLLAGIGKIRYIVETLRSAVPDDCVLHFGMQTNATLVTDKVADALKELGIRVGVSLDGNEQGNAHRPYHNKRSSFKRTVEGIQRLKERGILQRILTVIHLANDPEETAEFIFGLHDAVDLLLPIASWETESEPAQRPSLTTTPTPYADWIIRFYEKWVVMGAPGDGIRTMNKLYRLIAAWSWQIEFPHEERTEAVGPACVGDMLIDTDGQIGQLDGLDMVNLGDSSTPYNIFEHRLTHGLVAILQALADRKISEGSEICRSCDLFNICGGGYHLHRYGPKNGYVNVSYYCADLQRLIHYLAKEFWTASQDDPELKRRLAFETLEEVVGPQPKLPTRAT